MEIDIKRMTDRMDALKLKPEKLAPLVGCSISTIYTVKRTGKCHPMTAKLLAKALKCKVEEIQP
jgi:DNA-binding Xre family transcriptional regulator